MAPKPPLKATAAKKSASQDSQRGDAPQSSRREGKEKGTKKASKAAPKKGKKKAKAGDLSAVTEADAADGDEAMAEGDEATEEAVAEGDVAVSVEEAGSSGLDALTTYAGGGTMSKASLEKCLSAIGLQKSVLALAMEGAADSVELATWWSALNPRSAVVINAKLKERTAYKTLFDSERSQTPTVHLPPAPIPPTPRPDVRLTCTHTRHLPTSRQCRRRDCAGGEREGSTDPARTGGGQRDRSPRGWCSGGEPGDVAAGALRRSQSGDGQLPVHG